MFELVNVSKSFRGVSVLRQLFLKIHEGETLLLTGETGSGKSTIAKLLLRLTLPDEGFILYKGVPLETFFAASPRLFRSEVQMLFQDASASLDPLRRIEEILRESHELLFEKLDLHPLLLKKRPLELSVGERQRIALIRALVTNPQFLLLDEPTASLDKKRRELLFTLLHEWQKNGKKTLLIISHDQELVERLSESSRVIGLESVNAFSPKN